MGDSVVTISVSTTALYAGGGKREFDIPAV